MSPDGPEEDRAVTDDDVADENGDEPDAPLTGLAARRLGGGSRLPGWFPVAIIVLAVVTVGVVGVWQWRYDSDLAHERDDRKSATTAAATFATTLLTYDYRDLAGARDSVTALITDNYKTIYDQAFTIGLEPQITKLQATSVARVKDVYVTEITNGSAKAIVVVDADTTSTAGTRTLTGTYLQLVLIRTNGKYLVDSVTAVSTASESLTPPGVTPGASTTTTVPGSSTTTTTVPGG